MASCLTLTGYDKGCDDSVGGIKTIYFVEKQGLSGFGIDTGEITGVTLSSDYTGYTYDFVKDNSGWVEPTVGDGIVANIHWQPNITLVFRKMDTTLRNEVYNMSRGDLCAIIKDMNDIYWFIGYTNGITLSASAGGQSGLLLEDLNGYTLQITGKEPIPSYTIDISSGSSVDARILTAFGF